MNQAIIDFKSVSGSHYSFRAERVVGLERQVHLKTVKVGGMFGVGTREEVVEEQHWLVWLEVGGEAKGIEVTRHEWERVSENL